MRVSARVSLRPGSKEDTELSCTHVKAKLASATPTSLLNSKNLALSPHSKTKHEATDLCRKCVCSPSKQRRGMLEPGTDRSPAGLWVLLEARGGVSFWILRLGPCLSPATGCQPSCQGRVSRLTF